MNIPSTVIYDMQCMARTRKDRLDLALKEAAEAEKAYKKALASAVLAEAELRQVCSFLQEHNSEALGEGETWLQEFGLAEVPSLEVAKLLNTLEREFDEGTTHER